MVGMDNGVAWPARGGRRRRGWGLALAAWALAGLLGWLALWPLGANAQPLAGPTPGNVATLEVFVRAGCPHCAHAKQYLPTLAQQRPGVRVLLRPVDDDPQAAADLVQATRDAGHWPPGVPTFRYQGRVLVGFADAGRSGPELLQLIDGPSPAPAPEGPAAPPQGVADAASVELWRGLRLSLADVGLPAFTLAVGLVDGFNPCAMWVLLFLLSLLVHLRSRRRMALIAGTFVLVSGAVYYAFMAAWLNVFLAVGLSGVVRVGLALLALGMAAIHLKDFWLGLGTGVSLSIPASAKPGLYARMRQVVQAPSLALALLGVAALALAVNFVELLCTAGLPAMYTAVLAQQQLPPASHYGYLGLYILGYMADDTLMVGTAVLALNQRKLSDGVGRWLKLLSGVVMLALGLVMLLRPEWLG